MYENLVLVSKSDISRQGLSNILADDGFTVLKSCREVSELEAGEYPKDLVIVIDSPADNERNRLIEMLNAMFENPIVVVLADSFEFRPMAESFQAGARGYIIKSSRAVPLLAAIKLAAMGERVLPPDLLDVFVQPGSQVRVPAESAVDAGEVNLSPREHDVLSCLMAGYSNKVIARELDVCEATIKVHVKAILRKLNVHNRTQAAMWASSNGFADSRLVWQA